MDSSNPPQPTSSTTGTFYFAYGSNLSPTQMSLRLTSSPSSSVPVAIVCLPAYTWIICERGYANIVSTPSSPPTSINSLKLKDLISSTKNTTLPPPPPPSSSINDDSTTVYGVLYNLSLTDEATLDHYEGHNTSRNPNPTPNSSIPDRARKPHEQGNWDYNKLYLDFTVLEWLQPPSAYFSPHHLSSTNSNSDSNPSSVRALVYVDEHRTRPGRVNAEYIGRMNRGIAESVALGLPRTWVERVMRDFIPPDVFVKEASYVGTDRGYEVAETEEAYDEAMEEAVRAWREQRGLGGKILGEDGRD